MSNDIYVDLEEVISKIDVNRLSRDYNKFPIHTSKNGWGSEFLSKKELEYLYIELNLSKKELQLYLKCTKSRITLMLNKSSVYKPHNLRNKVREKTVFSRYGVSHVMKINSVKEEMKHTKFVKYGDEYFTNTEKTKQTKLERYGSSGYNNIDKIKQTNLEKYGYNYIGQVPEIQKKKEDTNLGKYGNVCSLHGYTEEAKKVQEKTKQTKIEKYGDENYVNIHKVRQTKLEKYGDENYHNIEKMKETLLTKYNVINVFQLEEVKQKSEKTCLQKYGKIRYNLTEEFQIKSYNTKKKNGTSSSSKPEKEMYQILLTKFPQTIHHPKPNEKYPFECDFYIPELNLYIEYQGHQSHGFEPFKASNPKHLSLIQDYQKRTQEINHKGEKKSQYLGYIKVWTFRDPLKRQTAWLNGIKWKEFFNMKQFMEWFDKQ